MTKLNFAQVLNASVPTKTCISIYIPHNQFFSGKKHRDSSFNSVINEARALAAKSSSSRIDSLLESIEKSKDDVLSQIEDHAVAWFISEDVNGVIPVTWTKGPFVVVSNTFHVKPVFRDLQLSRPYYVLGVNGRIIKLFRKWNDRLILLRSTSIPHLGVAEEHDSDLKKKREKSKSEALLIKTANKLIHEHTDFSDDPVVLAGEKSTVQKLSNELFYPYVVDEAISCNINRVSAKSLYKKSETIMSEYFRLQEDDILADFRYCQTAKKALNDLSDIAQAAISGRIEHLIIAEDEHLWGNLDSQTGAVSFHDHQRDGTDDDVSDDLSELVHRHRGAVWVIPKEKLDGKPVYATLRW